MVSFFKYLNISFDYNQLNNFQTVYICRQVSDHLFVGFRCYECSEKEDTERFCDDFIASSKFMVLCQNESCIQTYGSFGDYSGNIL